MHSITASTHRSCLCRSVVLPLCPQLGDVTIQATCRKPEDFPSCLIVDTCTCTSYFETTPSPAAHYLCQTSSMSIILLLYSRWAQRACRSSQGYKVVPRFRLNVAPATKWKLTPSLPVVSERRDSIPPHNVTVLSLTSWGSERTWEAQILVHK